jgi:hypothetical protein
MSGKIEISRELLETIVRVYPSRITDPATVRTIQAQTDHAICELRAILAAPVVESQPVILPERKDLSAMEAERDPYEHVWVRDYALMEGWNACLDKVKELNQ